VCRQIAEALEAAPASSVVHRDLKPANIKVTPDGRVKVLDFGLAKGGGASASSSPDQALSASPTMTYGATQAGVILGTAAYMSPEQARGKAVDRRTDIWSFGCVLFECLTGHMAFEGETVSDIVARILQGAPEWSALPAKTPERIRELLHRCLERDGKRRLRDIGEARIEIEDVLSGRAPVSSGIQATPVAAQKAASRRTFAVAALTAFVAAATAVFVTRATAPKPVREPVRFEINAPKGQILASGSESVQISPDGRTLAIIAADSTGQPRIWVRSLEALAPRVLPGTENATTMFWSPDSRYLAFFAGDKALSKIALSGGQPERICEAKSARGGTWNRDNVLVIAPYANRGLFRVSAGGGDLMAVTHPDSAHGETGHRFPQFLPDGKHFLFSGLPAGADGKCNVWIGSLDGSNPQLLLRADAGRGALYCEPGWLVLSRGNALIAQRFDARSRKLRGEPMLVGDESHASNFTGFPSASASNTGALAFPTVDAVPNRLVWLAPDGHELGAVPIKPGPYVAVRLSPDCRRAVVGKVEQTNTTLVVVDLERGVLTQLTEPPIEPSTAAWSPDQLQIAYADESGGAGRIIVESLVDGSKRTWFTTQPAFRHLLDWSADGRFILYEQLDATTKWDIWAISVEGDSTPRAIVRSPANEVGGRISPDGRWVTYGNDESGTPEVYVQPFAAVGPRYQVTIGGGIPLGWSRDARHLVYIDLKHPEGAMQAPVLAGADFALGPASLLLKAPEDLLTGDFDEERKRTLAVLPAEKPRPQTITVIENWQAGLRKP
jgi:Tol biopolymer transport system component